MNSSSAETNFLFFQDLTAMYTIAETVFSNYSKTETVRIPIIALCTVLSWIFGILSTRSMISCLHHAIRHKPGTIHAEAMRKFNNQIISSLKLVFLQALQLHLDQRRFQCTLPHMRISELISKWVIFSLNRFDFVFRAKLKTLYSPLFSSWNNL